MSFASMSPTDRIKASAMIGVIVILLFFVVHTVLGAVAPKGNAQNVANGPAANPGGAPAPPAPNAPTGENNANTAQPAGSGFPTEKVMASNTLTSTKLSGLAGSLDRDIPDPFVPIVSPQDKAVHPGGAPLMGEGGKTKKTQEPPVEVHPVSPSLASTGYDAPRGGLPGFSTGFAGPSGGTAQPMMSPMPVAPPAPDPEIRLIGLVQGEPSIATLQVNGRVVLAHSGDALAKGYRLMSISTEGIVVRHEKVHLPLRVGSAMNEAKDTKAP